MTTATSLEQLGYRACRGCGEPVRIRDGYGIHRDGCAGDTPPTRQQRPVYEPMTPVELVIPGRPGVWQRPANRADGGRRTADEHAAALEAAAWWVTSALPHRRRPYVKNGPVIVEVGFFYDRLAPRRADVDNLLKLLCDAMTGVVYLDDRQIVGVPPLRELHPRHVGEGEPRTVVRLYRPPEP